SPMQTATTSDGSRSLPGYNTRSMSEGRSMGEPKSRDIGPRDGRPANSKPDLGGTDGQTAATPPNEAETVTGSALDATVSLLGGGSSSAKQATGPPGETILG